MSLTNLFEDDASALKVSDDQVTGIAGLARRAKLLEKELADLEKTVSEKSEQYRKLTEQTIPEAMAEAGMRKFVMEDGSTIDVKPFYSASIPKARQEEAFQWLLCARLLNLLGTQGYPAEQAQKIEPQTLKAWVKERIEKGDQVDTELFGIFIGQKATIKTK
jgi:hypothetical protein